MDPLFDELFDTCDEHHQGDVLTSKLIAALDDKIQHFSNYQELRPVLMEIKDALDPSGCDGSVEKNVWLSVLHSFLNGNLLEDKATECDESSTMESPAGSQGFMNQSRQSYSFSPDSCHSSASLEKESEEVLKLRQQNQELLTVNKTLQSQVQTLEDLLAQEETENTEIQRKEKSLLEEINRLKSQAASFQESESDFKSSIEKCEHEKLQLCQMLKQLTMEFNDQKKEMKAMSAELEQVVNHRDNLTLEIESLRSDFKASQEATKKCLFEKEALGSKLISLNLELENLSAFQQEIPSVKLQSPSENESAKLNVSNSEDNLRLSSFSAILSSTHNCDMDNHPSLFEEIQAVGSSALGENELCSSPKERCHASHLDFTPLSDSSLIEKEPTTISTSSEEEYSLETCHLPEICRDKNIFQFNIPQSNKAHEMDGLSQENDFGCLPEGESDQLNNNHELKQVEDKRQNCSPEFPIDHCCFDKKRNFERCDVFDQPLKNNDQNLGEISSSLIEASIQVCPIVLEPPSAQDSSGSSLCSNFQKSKSTLDSNEFCVVTDIQDLSAHKPSDEYFQIDGDFRMSKKNEESQTEHSYLLSCVKKQTFCSRVFIKTSEQLISKVGENTKNESQCEISTNEVRLSESESNCQPDSNKESSFFHMKTITLGIFAIFNFIRRNIQTIVAHWVIFVLLLFATAIFCSAAVLDVASECGILSHPLSASTPKWMKWIFHNIVKVHRQSGKKPM